MTTPMAVAVPDKIAEPTDPPPLTAILVRHAVHSDLFDIEAIYRPHVLNSAATFEETPPSIPTLQARLDAVVDQGLPFLVAELCGRVVGFAYAAPYRPRSAARFTVEDSIYIDESLAGRGIGRVLMAELLSQCASAGVRQLIAMVGDSANTRSIQLHQRMGFTIEAVLHDIGFKHGKWVDMVLMKCHVGPGSNCSPSPTPDGRGP